jgi:hypothetical protein
MKVEIKVCVRDVLAILFVPYIPNTAIKRLPNFSKNIREGSKLTGEITSTFVRHSTYEDESVTDEVSHGSEEGWTILETFVRDKEIFTFLDVGHIP